MSCCISVYTDGAECIALKEGTIAKMSQNNSILLVTEAFSIRSILGNYFYSFLFISFLFFYNFFFM